RGPGPQLGQTLFADRTRDAKLSAIDMRHGRGLRVGQREERVRAAVLLERNRECRESRVRRVRGHLEGAGRADEAIGLLDRQARWYAATGDHIEAGEREPGDENERDKPSEHGLNNTSLLTYGIRRGEWRYRLGVRTRGSQPRDRGSIPRTATKSQRASFQFVPRVFSAASALSAKCGTAETTRRLSHCRTASSRAIEITDRRSESATPHAVPAKWRECSESTGEMSGR